MKHQTASWKTLLLLSLLMRAFLQTTAQPAGVSLLMSVPVGLLLWLFLAIWDRAAPEGHSFWPLCPVLLYAAVLSALRLYHALTQLEASDLPGPVLLVLLILPAILLLTSDFARIFQFSLAVKWFAIAAVILLWVSLWGVFRAEHLQLPLDFDGQTFLNTGCSLAVLCPEYLILALFRGEIKMPNSKKRIATATATLVVWYLVFRCALALVLELALGSASAEDAAPLQTAARLGALFMMDRVDFIQVILWYLLTLLQLALYLNAALAQMPQKAGRWTLCFGCLAAAVLLREVRIVSLEQTEQLLLLIAFVLGLLWKRNGKKCAREKCKKEDSF